MSAPGPIESDLEPAVLQYLSTGKFPLEMPRDKRLAIKNKASHLRLCEARLFHVDCREYVADPDRLIRKFHEDLGHADFNKTHDGLKTLYYWKGMHLDCRAQIRLCDACQRVNPKNEDDPWRQLTPSEPFARVAVDLAVFCGRTFVVLVDYPTRWTMAQWIPNKRPATIINFLTSFIENHDVPRQLLSDNGGSSNALF